MPGNVLMVAFFFPPLGGAGVQRSVKFAKYLPRSGWQPVVLTSNSQRYHALDPTLQAEVPETVQVIRTAIWETGPVYEWLYKLRLDPLARWLRGREAGFLLPDNRIGWLPFAYTAGLRAIQSERVDVIFTTSAPYTAHLIGWALKQRTGKPWVADFRDEWLELPHLGWTGLRRTSVARMERAVLSGADVISVTTDRIGALLADKVGAANKVWTIPNGYDEEDFAEAAARGVRGREGKFVITYTGSLYPPQSPTSFLHALARLIRDEQGFGLDAEVRFIGPGVERSTIDALGLDGIVYTTQQSIPHLDALTELLSASVLLLIHSTARGPYVVPGKIFEYLRAGKPILALVPPDSVAAGMVHDIGAGVVVAPEDIEQICEAVGRYYRRWKAGTLTTSPRRELVQQYDRQRTARQLADAFESLTARQQAARKG